MAWVYMLRCSDDSIYVGSTHNLDMRVDQHEKGLGGDYTSRRRPVTLVYADEFERIDDAFAWERRLHGWSRAKKEAVIRGDWKALPGLARRRSRRAE